ncbi:MAG TPA: NUDIX domain-containing protein [Baekduia sp.]|jgi:8-oxo-dGTP pyrophosphatase MutT (NUDIX family)
MTQAPASWLLARGPWRADQVHAVWRDETFVPDAAKTAAADLAIQALRDRSSPSHDGTGARLVEFDATDGELHMELQPLRWALRLVDGDASETISALCVTRDSEGRWLAGRRAAWLASWAGRWALGAGGAVDEGESPFTTLTRELLEEWSVTAERVQGEALIQLPHKMVLFIGQAWLPAGVEVVPDHEHDAYAWWPADIDAWPDEADDTLRGMARMLA